MKIAYYVSDKNKRSTKDLLEEFKADSPAHLGGRDRKAFNIQLGSQHVQRNASKEGK